MTSWNILLHFTRMQWYQWHAQPDAWVISAWCGRRLKRICVENLFVFIGTKSNAALDAKGIGYVTRIRYTVVILMNHSAICYIRHGLRHTFTLNRFQGPRDVGCRKLHRTQEHVHGSFILLSYNSPRVVSNLSCNRNISQLNLH